MDKIGVWNTAFLGDAVLTLPLIQTLKANFPQAEIHFWVRKGFEGLFESHPDLAAVHSFDKRGRDRGLAAAWRLGRSISRMGFGLWISAHRSVRSAFIARWSSVKVRIGYNTPWFNRWCYTHTVDRSFHRLEEVERLLRLGDPLRMDTVITKPRLVLPASALEHAEVFWRERLADEGRPVLGLHPGSAWPTKRWPADRFRSVVAGAVERGATVLVFGGPGEEGLAAQAAAGCERHVHNLAGRLTLPELAACIARLDCYLCNDSGPMHLAWVQDVPVVALFGPTVRRLGFFPRGPRSLVLERDMPCRPCGLHGGTECPAGTHACMLDIGADVVLDAVWKELTDGTRRGS